MMISFTLQDVSLFIEALGLPVIQAPSEAEAETGDPLTPSGEMPQPPALSSAGGFSKDSDFGIESYTPSPAISSSTVTDFSLASSQVAGEGTSGQPISHFEMPQQIYRPTPTSGGSFTQGQQEDNT